MSVHDCRRAACTLSLLVLAGCAGTAHAPSAPVASFPSAGELHAIEQRTPPAKVVDGDLDLGEGFTTDAAPPGTLGDRPREAGTPWERTLGTTLPSDGRVKLTEETHCAAREAGRFYLDRGRHPANRVRRFILGRCGSIAPDVHLRVAETRVPAGLSEARIHDDWRAALVSSLEALADAAPGTAGVWFGRSGERVVVMFALTESKARLRPVDPHPDAAGRVVIEGVVNAASDGVLGYINRGTFGVAACDLDMGVRLPAFRVSCPLQLEDAEAEIELYSRAPGHVLARPIASVLARTVDTLPSAFTLPRHASEAPVRDGAGFATLLIEQLNAIRGRAGLMPVKLSKPQSKTAAQLAPHYFAAYLQQQADTTDTIALGLLAGWEVQGTIRDGSFMSSIVAPSNDAGQWLDEALSRPSGRMTLLDPETRTLAVGALVSAQPRGIAAAVVGYKFHESTDHTADVDALFGRIVRARKRLGLEAPKRLGPLMEPMQRELSRVHRGEAVPAGALDEVLTVGVQDLQRSMRGYQLEATALELVEIPDEILRAPQLFLEIGVTHHKPPGAAWGQYVVLIAYVDPGKKT